MPSPFHHQTVGQTESANQMLKNYLPNYCIYEQDNWSKMTPIAEYAYNNSLTTATGKSLFFAKFVSNPQTNWPIEVEAKNLASRNYVQWMTSVHALCCMGLQQAQETMGKYHNWLAKEPLKYSVGDLVMLNWKNLKP
jgi:hypothetical protein